MVTAIRQVEIVLGNGIKKPTLSEEKIKIVVRKSLIARINISKGTKISKEMLTIKRLGTGLAPKYFDKIIGKRAIAEIRKDEPIVWNKIKI